MRSERYIDPDSLVSKARARVAGRCEASRSFFYTCVLPGSISSKCFRVDSMLPVFSPLKSTWELEQVVASLQFLRCSKSIFSTSASDLFLRTGGVTTATLLKNFYSNDPLSQTDKS